MDNGMTLSDIAAVTRDNDDWGGNGAWWIIILFLFMFGNGGFWGRNNGQIEQPVTEGSLCNAMNFNNLENAIAATSVSIANIIVIKVA